MLSSSVSAAGCPTAASRGCTRKQRLGQSRRRVRVQKPAPLLALTFWRSACRIHSAGPTAGVGTLEASTACRDGSRRLGACSSASPAPIPHRRGPAASLPSRRLIAHTRPPCSPLCAQQRAGHFKARSSGEGIQLGTTFLILILTHTPRLWFLKSYSLSLPLNRLLPRLCRRAARKHHRASRTKGAGTG